jgi:predicted permease
MIAIVAGILLPVFIVASIGYGWAKLGFPLDRDFVTRLVINVATPCLVVDSIASLELPVVDLLEMLLSASVMFALTALLAGLILRLASLPLRSFLPSLTFGNAGNLALPLSFLAFGATGLGLSAGVFLTAVVIQFTLAPALQDGRPALKVLATTPVVYGSAIGVALLATQTTLPAWLASTIELLAGIAIPLSLLTLGFSLAEFRVKRLPVAVGLGLARMALGFVVAATVAALFGLTGIARGVLLLHGGMPTALVCYLFSARYGRDPEDVAGIVLVSTLLAVVLMPLLVAYALWAAGTLPS